MHRFKNGFNFMKKNSRIAPSRRIYVVISGEPCKGAVLKKKNDLFECIFHNFKSYIRSGGKCSIFKEIFLGPTFTKFASENKNSWFDILVKELKRELCWELNVENLQFLVFRRLHDWENPNTPKWRMSRVYVYIWVPTA